MKKLITSSAIAFLMVFTAGLASAAGRTPACTATECSESGTLVFAAVDGSSVTRVPGITLTLNSVPGTVFWTGTLVFPSSSAIFPSTTMNISAIRAPDQDDDSHLFRDIAGTDATTSEVILQAEGRDNAKVWGSKQLGFGIHGTIHSSTFDGSFHGPLFP